MKKVLILSNSGFIIYKFRKELIEHLSNTGYEVYTAFPFDEGINSNQSNDELKKLGCKFVNTKINRKGMNPIQDIYLLLQYLHIAKKVKPDIVLSYTIKPNIYSGIVCRMNNIKHIANVTGIGTAFNKNCLVRAMLTKMYRIAFKKSSCIFFQNEENMNAFLDSNIIHCKYSIIPGSGVNLEYYKPLEYPDEDVVNFAFISRIMKEKGIEMVLETAQYIRNKYPNTKFHICGYLEQDYQNIIEDYGNKNIIEYHGVVDDIRDILKVSHCVIHPTFYPEGISNVLLESAACARPIITTNQSGCKEVVIDNINGFLIEANKTDDLIKKVEIFLEMDNSDRKIMGQSGRKIVEKNFDRNKVVRAYDHEIKLAIQDK